MAEDVYTTSLIREAKLPTLRFRSPQQEDRLPLVNWICNTCDTFKLKAPCRHLAITYMDYFMDYYMVDKAQLELLGLACILIAGKNHAVILYTVAYIIVYEI